MKIKFKYEDFFVEEILKNGVIGRKGNFTVYKVEKTGLESFTLLQIISQKLKVPRGFISSAGLKDKYSVSVQYVAVKGEGPEKIEEKNFRAIKVGKSERPLTAKDIERNYFRIVLRDIHPDEVKDYEERLKIVRDWGFPNYFDEQRFGSVKMLNGEKKFIGKEIVLKNYENALKLHFLSVSDYPRKKVRMFKKLIIRFWGNWNECLKFATAEEDKKIIRYLKTAGDIKNALNLIEKRLMRFYLEVYQSYIFNEVLGRLIKPPNYKFPYNVGFFIFPLTPQKLEGAIYLPHPKAKIEHKEYYKVLEKEGISLKDFKTELQTEFPKHKRYLWEKPQNLEWNIEEDEFHRKRKKITLSFSIHPGSYATMLIKFITPLNPKSHTAKKPLTS